MELGLEGKVAAIAGATKGTGRATAIRMAREGVKVAYCGRSLDRLRELEKEITEFGGTCLPIECDLSDRAAAGHFVAETLKAFGQLDIAVFTPSLHVSREFLDLTDDEWEESYNITFHAAVRLTRAAIPQMQAQHWGRIVLVGAGSVYKQSVGIGIGHKDVHPDFTTAKAALTNLSKFLSKNFGTDNIFVNCVHPAFVFPTETHAAFAQRAAEEGVSGQESFLRLATDVGYIPALGRAGTSEDCANVITFLCSEANGYVTGVEIAVDGGGLDIG
jgi:NAD(P)-dependent dehydrogenase (short-subunit alcohol dehydrogenase family)